MTRRDAGSGLPMEVTRHKESYVPQLPPTLHLQTGVKLSWVVPQTSPEHFAWLWFHWIVIKSIGNIYRQSIHARQYFADDS